MLAVSAETSQEQHLRSRIERTQSIGERSPIAIRQIAIDQSDVDIVEHMSSLTKRPCLGDDDKSRLPSHKQCEWLAECGMVIHYEQPGHSISKPFLKEHARSWRLLYDNLPAA